MISRMTVALVSSFLFATGALATDAVSQHGGRVVEAGEYHVEIVSKAGTVDVFLADHSNKAVRSTGHKGLAILVVEGKSQRIVLEPADESKLSGKAAGDLPGAPKGVVQITLPGGKTVQARFN